MYHCFDRLDSVCKQPAIDFGPEPGPRSILDGRVLQNNCLTCLGEQLGMIARRFPSGFEVRLRTSSLTVQTYGDQQVSHSERLQNRSRLVCSPAKINLFLEVTDRRPDGFHQLETVMVRTDLCDTLRFEVREDDTIRLKRVGARNLSGTETTDFPAGESNLIVKAARVLQRLGGGSCGATIHVHKRIPSGAGLGGGSGNAAVTLLTLNQLWGLNLPKAVLHETASQLGSDVNFLLSGCRAAFCTGRGEQIRPLTINGHHTGLLIVPRSSNSTAEVFRAVKVPKTPRGTQNLIESLGAESGPEIRQHVFNRLQSVAQELNPDVGTTLSRLDAYAGGGYMTGSGSGCFTLLRSAADARRLARQFRNEGVGLVTVFRF